MCRSGCAAGSLGRLASFFGGSCTSLRSCLFVGCCYFRARHTAQLQHSFVYTMTRARGCKHRGQTRVVASIVLQVQRTLEERGRQQLPTADCRGRRTRGSVQVVLSVRRARAHAFASLDKLQPSASLAARIEKDSVAPRKSPANCKASRRSTGEHGRAGRQPPARERRQQSWRGASGCTRLPGRAHWACCEC